MKKRAIIIVIDSMGIGAMPDCEEFGDIKECNTLKNVCEFNNGLDLPVMEAMGLGNIQDFKGIKKTACRRSAFNHGCNDSFKAVLFYIPKHIE